MSYGDVIDKGHLLLYNYLIIKGCMTGLKPAVVGMIGAAFISMCITVFLPSGNMTDIFTRSAFYAALLILAVCAIMVFKKLHPIIFILFSAAAGIAAGYILNL